MRKPCEACGEYPGEAARLQDQLDYQAKKIKAQNIRMNEEAQRLNEARASNRKALEDLAARNRALGFELKKLDVIRSEMQVAKVQIASLTRALDAERERNRRLAEYIGRRFGVDGERAAS